jgi:hypothetical protein
MPRLTRKTVLTAAFAAMWIAALTAGLGALAHYENRPGNIGASPTAWPSTSRIARSNNSYTLVMLAHPHCPCTRASVNELAQIMAHVQGKVRAYVLFLKPRNSGSDWDDTDLRRSASRIPNVTILNDVDGEEANRFGAETSGHTLVFDGDGKRIFSGGITGSRGHQGDNVGESAIVSLVNAQPALRSTSVFGCSLRSHAQPKGTPCPN